MQTYLPLKDFAFEVDQELASISVCWNVDQVSQKTNFKLTTDVRTTTAFLLSSILTKRVDLWSQISL